MTHIRGKTVAILAVLSAGCASSQSQTPPDHSTASVDERSEPVERTLQRKFPGVHVARTADGSITFQIRGSSSYTDRNTPPLYVVNGAPVKAGPDGALVGIDPYEIETVKVLSAAESALYGIDGANGVIVITTKRPAKPSRP